MTKALGAEPYMVVISPLNSRADRLSLNEHGDRLAVLCIRDPDDAQETRVELLQRLYGLTGSEARLTDLIALGKSR